MLQDLMHSRRVVRQQQLPQVMVQERGNVLQRRAARVQQQLQRAQQRVVGPQQLTQQLPHLLRQQRLVARVRDSAPPRSHVVAAQPQQHQRHQLTAAGEQKSECRQRGGDLRQHQQQPHHQ